MCQLSLNFGDIQSSSTMAPTSQQKQEQRRQPKLWVKTPLIESARLSKLAGCKILLKLESFQPSGSFKSRGIGCYMLSQLCAFPANSLVKPAFYSSSAGNAGLACATAAAQLGVPATIVCPTTTPPIFLGLLADAGARVIQHGDSWADADRLLREEILPFDVGGIYVPPFDAPAIWEGNSTLMDEVVAELTVRGEPLPDVIVTSVGGGGLFNGLMQGIDRVFGWEPTILAVETEGAESLAATLAAGKLVSLPGITSSVKSLGCVRVSEETFRYCTEQAWQVKNVVLTDSEAERGAVALAEAERVLGEAACGVSVAAACFDRARLRKWIPGVGPDTRILVVACGGRNCDVETLARWKREVGGLAPVVPVVHGKGGLETEDEGLGIRTPPEEETPLPVTA